MTFMRRGLIYGVLAVVWLMIVGWQTFDHQRVRESARRGLANRAHDLAAALSVVIRSQGWAAVAPKPSLEAALSVLVDSTELESVTLLTQSGEVAASAGKSMRVDTNTLLRTHEVWSEDSASFANLVALGPGAEHGPTLLLLDVPRPEDGHGPQDSNRPGGQDDKGAGTQDDKDLGPQESDRPEPPGRSGPFGEPRTPEAFLRNPMLDRFLDEEKRKALLAMIGDKPLSVEQINTILGYFPKGEISEERAETLRRALVGRPLTLDTLQDVLMIVLAPGHGPDRRREHDRGPGPPTGPPPWMSSKDYERLVAERGVHWFLVTIPTETLRTEMARDLRLRGIVLGVALLACLAIGLAWRAFERSSHLVIRLVRAEETTHRLQELNLAAAGLVHETKNPLNLIRGLAQIIGREGNVPLATRNTALKITEEADRVTGRLNQFLDYARPVQPHPKPLELYALVKSVFDVLAFDREEKSVIFAQDGTALRVHADEDMLRQMLFNLILNAVQAVPMGGRVEVRAAKDNGKTVYVDVRDDGPGIPAELREEVFRPYFTTSDKGTGLGLAVVRQIALAHDWAVACVPSEGGTIIRIRGLLLAQETVQRSEHE